MKHLKIIADVNIEKPIIDYLVEQGYDVKWISDYNRKLADKDLLNLDNKEKRILITNDRDFGELIFLQKKLSKGLILIRVKGQQTQTKVMLIKKLFKRFSDKLPRHFVVITKKKMRFIPMGKI
ncbi:MAG: DUF5615 family PIN-like protein [Candidatus Anammoxibacter sp.]